MNIKQALQRRDQAQSQIRDLWSRGAHFGMLHSAMLDPARACAFHQRNAF